MASSGIYVEVFIAGTLDQVWALTQTPEVHQRWDLRFTSIEYLPRPSDADPQRFLYETQLLGPLAIRGTGESVGQRVAPDGIASSALRFGSEQWWSLIRTGSGYWRYVPCEGGLRFLTWYDYDTRFGIAGRVVNALVLRPAMGWATAWSFDRLRLWVERAQTPEVSLVMAVVHAVARITIAAVWLWHGLVPKLLFHDAAERTMVLQAGLPAQAVVWAGVGEILWGVLMLVGWRCRWMFIVNILMMLFALAGVAMHSREYLTQAFNPVTLNLCVAALALLGYLVAAGVPTAARCLRRKPKEAA